MKTCPACQERLPDESMFCGVCGFRLTPIAQFSPTAMAQGVAANSGPIAPFSPTAMAQGVAANSGPVVPFDARSIGDAATAPIARADSDIPEHRSGSPARQSQRFPLKIEVTYSSEHNFYTGFLQNVSSGGLFVATHHLASVGETVTVVFTVPGLADSCEANCEVTWVRDHEVAGLDASPGMGLRFLNLDASVAEAIDGFIRHRDPIFFEE